MKIKGQNRSGQYVPTWYHWMASHWVVAEDGMKNIVAFNLATEKFQVFTTPLQNHCLTWLEVLEWHLCLIVIARWCSMMFGWIWGKGLLDSGFIKFSCVVAWNFQYWKPLMFSKNCKKVQMEECHMDRTYLIRYDIENKIHKTVEIHKLPRSFQATTCIEKSSFAWQ